MGRRRPMDRSVPFPIHCNVKVRASSASNGMDKRGHAVPVLTVRWRQSPWLGNDRFKENNFTCLHFLKPCLPDGSFSKICWFSSTFMYFPCKLETSFNLSLMTQWVLSRTSHPLIAAKCHKAKFSTYFSVILCSPLILACHLMHFTSIFIQQTKYLWVRNILASVL